MPEYIEREAIEYPYMTMTLWGLNNATCKAYNEGVKAAADAIAAMPASDVVAVVRCKDCICRKEPELYGELQCGLLGIPMNANDFCNYGERRADNATD